MSVAATIRQNSVVGGKSFAESKTIEGDGQIVHDVTIPAANAGTLTTRTDATDGEITMDESTQTIETGDRIDLYWTTAGVVYARRGVTAGTVSGVTVPISGGDGDNLPTQDAVIIGCAVVELDVVVDGDNIDACLASLAKYGQVVFLDIDVSDVEITYWTIGEGAVKMWHDEDGDDNPFAGEDLGRVYVSHMDTAAAGVLFRLGIIYNNVAG